MVYEPQQCVYSAAWGALRSGDYVFLRALYDVCRHRRRICRVLYGICLLYSVCGRVHQHGAACQRESAAEKNAAYGTAVRDVLSVSFCHDVRGADAGEFYCVSGTQ